MLPAVMIDMETLSTDLDAVILTLGGVKFDPYSMDEPYDPIYMRIDVDEQIAAGRSYNEDTIKWWGNQSEEVREEALGEDGRISMVDALKEFQPWVLHCDTIWSNGATFDVMVMENFYNYCGWFHPWEYWRIRCCRTVFNMGVNPRMPKDSLHNALADAYEQAKAVQRIFSELEVEAPFKDKK